MSPNTSISLFIKGNLKNGKIPLSPDNEGGLTPVLSAYFKSLISKFFFMYVFRL